MPCSVPLIASHRSHRQVAQARRRRAREEERIERDRQVKALRDAVSRGVGDGRRLDVNRRRRQLHCDAQVRFGPQTLCARREQQSDAIRSPCLGGKHESRLAPIVAQVRVALRLGAEERPKGGYRAAPRRGEQVHGANGRLGPPAATWNLRGLATCWKERFFIFFALACPPFPPLA